MGQATGRLLALLAAAVAVTAGPAASPADAPSDAEQACIERALDAIQRRYASLRDLQARFVQTTRSVALGGPASGRATTSRGTVTLAKPGKMRWSYEEPEPSLVVSDGETLWIFDPALREVQRLPVGEGYLSAAAVQFLLGEGDLRREFEVTAESCAGDAVQLEFVPRRPASYERLRVRPDLATGDLIETRVVDLLGNVTTVEFQEIRVNLHPPPESFVFDPPPGVRVIELDTPADGRSSP